MREQQACVCASFDIYTNRACKMSVLDGDETTRDDVLHVKLSERA